MDRLRDLLVGGAVLYVVGLAVLIFAWPSDRARRGGGL
jgi:hypothetical protein